MNKSAYISKIVFGVLALISVVVTVLFFVLGGPEWEPWQAWFNADLPVGWTHDAKDPATAIMVILEPSTLFTDILMYWSYVKVFLGIFIVLVSALVAAIVKGVDIKTILILLGAIVVIGGVSYLISRGYFYVPYVDYSTGKEVFGLNENGICLAHGFIEWGINFFYITLGVSIITIIYSAIRSSIK